MSSSEHRGESPPLDVTIQTGRNMVIIKPQNTKATDWCTRNIGRIVVGRAQWEVGLASACIVVNALRRDGFFVEEVTH